MHSHILLRHSMLSPPHGESLSKAVQDHLAGKQYLGWLAIREKLAEVQKDDEKRGSAPRPAERPREPEKEKDSRYHLPLPALTPSSSLSKNQAQAGSPACEMLR